jgi:GT2 family glycosyltransferase
VHLSVIIPTCNRPEDLRRCLERLVAQVRFDAGEEVIVTDDGGTEEARQVVETFPGVRWTQGPRRGPAANRNHGASLATGEWLVFLDDDCLPEAGWLEAYRDATAKTEIPRAALEGKTLREALPPSLMWEAPHNPEGGHLISCNFAIRSADFDAVGRFDARYPVAALEDTEFAARFAGCGGTVRFVPEAAVLHPLRRVPSGRKLAARWEGKVIFALDQGASPMVVMLWLPWHVFRVIGSRFRGRGFGEEHGAAVLRFASEWAWVCWRTPGWIRRRRKEARSAYWEMRRRSVGPVPRFGF